jgi:hypothetical protein
MKQTYLSWDCANKSLAWALVVIDFGVIGLCRDVLKSTVSVEEKSSLLLCHTSNFITVLDLGCVDLIGGLAVKNTDNVTRARNLKKFLEDKTLKMALPKDTIVIIEHQPPRLSGKFGSKIPKSTIIEHQLTYFFSDYKIVLVSPKMKTQNEIRGPTSKSMTYVERKRHSVEDFRYIIELFDLKVNMPKKCDDIADAFNQIFSVIKFSLEAV